MAYKRLKYKDRYEDEVAEFLVDVRADIADLPTNTSSPDKCAIGSMALCLDDCVVYTLNNANQWVELDPISVSANVEVVNNLTTEDKTKVLSAEMGKLLKDLVDGKVSKEDIVDDLTGDLTGKVASAEAVKEVADAIPSNSDLIAFSDTEGNIVATNVKGALTESAVKIADNAADITELQNTGVDATARAQLALIGTFLATNAISNGDMQNTTGWTPSGCTLSVLNNILSVTASATGTTVVYFDSSAPYVSGRKVYVRAVVKAKNEGISKIDMIVRGTTSATDGTLIVGEVLSPVTDSEYLMQSVVTAGATPTGNIRVSFRTTCTPGDVVEIKYVLLIVTTSTFGAGKEPSVEDMSSLLSIYTNSWFGGTVDLASALVAVDCIKRCIMIGNSYTATKFAGKSLHLFGDSITYWDNRYSWLDSSYLIIGYPTHITRRLKAVVTNNAIAGATMITGIRNSINATNLSSAYACIITGGTNDAAQGLAVGAIDSTDVSNYIGALKQSIGYCYSQNASIKLYLLAPIKSMSYDVTPYCDAMESVASLYGIPVLRMDKKVQISTLNQASLMIDGVHPNNLGYINVADAVVQFLINN